MNIICKVFYLFLILLITIITACSKPDEEPEEQAPEIVVLGRNPLKTGIYTGFVDDSVKMQSAFGLDSAWSIRKIDTSLLGKYTVEYYARSLSGLESTAQRDVWVVVVPESMADSTWQVKLIPENNEIAYFNDTLITSNDKRNIIIKNFHNIRGAAVELEPASDLNDVVYINKQELNDMATVEGKGMIDNKAMLMLLDYSFISGEDTLHYQAVYTRDFIPPSIR